MENSEFAPSAQITLCDDPSPRNIAEFAVKILDSKKARDIKLLYVEDQTSIADWFVVCTGTSSTHIDSLAQEVEYRLSKVRHRPAPYGGRTRRQLDTCRLRRCYTSRFQRAETRFL